MAIFNTTPASFEKEDSEVYAVTFDYTNYVPSGTTITAAAVTAKILSTGVDATSTVLSGSTTIQVGDLLVDHTVQAGADGVIYRITCTGTGSASETLVLVTDMVVIAS
jgi:hypothetical protein